MTGNATGWTRPLRIAQDWGRCRGEAGCPGAPWICSEDAGWAVDDLIAIDALRVRGFSLEGDNYPCIIYFLGFAL